MTDARIGSDLAEVAMTGVTSDVRVGSDLAEVAILATNVEARAGAVGATVVHILDPTTYDGRLAAMVVQVAIQINRGYVTDFQGNPVRVFAGGTSHPVHVT